MRIQFRAKLLVIVGASALAFLLILLAAAVTEDQVDRQIGDIQRQYLPRVELAPRLEGQLEAVRRAFLDAVAARDLDALAATREPKARVLQELAFAAQAVDPAQVAALRDAFEDYYGAAHDVSKRLISGETGEALVGAMAA